MGNFSKVVASPADLLRLIPVPLLFSPSRSLCRSWSDRIGRAFVACAGLVRVTLFTLVVAPLCAEVAQEPGPDTPRMSSMDELWIVPDERKHQLHWLDTEIIVGYWDTTWGLSWGWNGQRAPFLAVAPDAPKLRPGQRVRLEGWVKPFESPTSKQFRITVLESQVPLPIQEPTGPLDEAGRWEEQFVWVNGLVVEQLEEDPEHLALRISADGVPALARLQIPATAAQPQLLGAFVRFPAVYIHQADVDGRITAIELWIPDYEQVQVKGWLGSDSRFERESLDVADVAATTEALVRLVGRVRQQQPGSSITLRDDSGQILVETNQVAPLAVGEVVEVIGYPVAAEAGYKLARALYRPLDATRRLPTELVSKLRVAEQVLELPPEEAQRALPVELNGVVTWTHPAAEFFFFRDVSGAVRVVIPPGMTDRPAPGSTVRVDGTTASGEFTPVVVARSFRGTRAFKLPEPYPSSLDQALTGVDEAQRIELRGFVRSVTENPPWTDLQVITSAGEFEVRLPAAGNAATFQSAMVRVRGVCTAITNERRQLTGVRLWAADTADVTVEEAAPADAFAVAERTVASLRRFSATQASHRRVRVSGVVVHHVPARYLILQDGAEALLVLSRWDGALQPGDRVEAVGIPGRESSRLVLREAIVRRTGQGAQPAPIPLSEFTLPVSDLDGCLVEVRGTLLEAITKNGEVRLVVQSGQEVLDVVFEGLAAGADWVPGSQVRLVGVYSLVFDEYRNPRSFRVQLRSLADVEVERLPSWWTAGRALTVAGLLALGCVLALVFIEALRRRVRAQTRQIRVQLAQEAKLQARYRDIVDNATDFIFMTDRNGRFLSFNPAGERVTGWTEQEALQRRLQDLFHPEDLATALQYLKRGVRGEGIVNFQSRFRRKDGREVWVETTARLLREGRSVVGVLGVARDISERKEFEDELKRARDLAEASARAKSAFLANMSHEIRTPMNGVIGMSNLLLDTELTLEQRDFADTIRHSAEALLSVLNDILDFSKIEAGKLQIEELDFDLGDVVDSTLELLAARAFAKRLELASFLPIELPRRLRGDPGRIRQVLLNLIGNAVKFTEHGEVVVAASCEHETATEARLRFEITDTGIGLSADQQAELFQAFSQADASTTRRFGGTGLGLAICKQIVELMGGQIGVQSQAGQGSTFWFTIHLPKAPPLPDAGLASEPVALEGRRVLVVDDNATNRRILRHYTAGWKMEPELVTSAMDGLRVLRAAVGAGRPFDLVLLDYQMPEMDGVDFAQAVADDPSLDGTRVVMLTSLDRRFTRVEMQKIGLAEVLTKPVRQGELRDTLLSLFGRVVPAPVLAPVLATQALPPKPKLRLRVLVAEDNPVNLRITLMQLRKLGCEADMAGNGLEVLEAIERAPYDVVLMDCQMPELDGYETSRRMRQMPQLARVRIIAVTAHAMEGDRTRCLEAGMDDYVSKPVRAGELEAALQRAAAALGARSDEPQTEPRGH